MIGEEMSGTKVFRTVIAACSIFAMITMMSPLAVGSAHGKSASPGKKPRITVPGLGITFPGGFKGQKGLTNANNKLESEGKTLEAQARAFVKKLQGKKGSASPAISAAITVYDGARQSAITTFQGSTTVARDGYQVAVEPTAVIQKAAYVAAKTVLQTALASATTKQAKQSAQNTYDAALKVADVSFTTATANVLAFYKVAVSTAQEAQNAALQAANSAFRQALLAAHAIKPTPNASISATPTPTATK